MVLFGIVDTVAVWVVDETSADTVVADGIVGFAVVDSTSAVTVTAVVDTVETPTVVAFGAADETPADTSGDPVETWAVVVCPTTIPIKQAAPKLQSRDLGQEPIFQAGHGSSLRESSC